MGKVMKFERKAARQERKDAPAMPAPGVPVKETVVAIEEPKAETKSAPINPLEQIAKYVKSMDLPRVKAMVRRASASGVKEEDIDSAVDAALPEGAELPLHHLVAIASLASDGKRASYLPFFEQHLAGDSDGSLREHLRSIGMENL